MTKPSLAHEISARWCYRWQLHEVIVKRLIQTSKLSGFTGHLFHGEFKGRDPSLNEDIPPLSWVTDLLGINEVVVEYKEPLVTDLATDVDADTDVFIELLDNLAVTP